MKKTRHPFDRYLIDSRLLEEKNLNDGLRQFAETRPDRQAFVNSRRRLAAEMGRTARSPVPGRLVWSIGYAALLVMASTLAYNRGLDQGVATARLIAPLPVVARLDRKGASRLPKRHAVRRNAATGKQPAGANQRDVTISPSEELAAAVAEELPVVEQSAKAYENLAQSETDPHRKLEALDRAADIYATLLNDTDRAVSTYQHQVNICDRYLSEPTVPDTSAQTHDASQMERLRLQRDKARLEIALAKNAEGGQM
jgi:hypothetical protein